jgi:hypothetical protein
MRHGFSGVRSTYLSATQGRCLGVCIRSQIFTYTDFECDTISFIASPSSTEAPHPSHISQTMAPLPTTTPASASPASNILATLPKRSLECTYYDTSCSTHRIVILIIFIVCGFGIGGMLALVYFRGRRRRSERERQARLRRENMQLRSPFNNRKLVLGGAFDAPPPPYAPRLPRKPESVAKGGR